jgi:hypothetical protein
MPAEGKKHTQTPRYLWECGSDAGRISNKIYVLKKTCSSFAGDKFDGM